MSDSEPKVTPGPWRMCGGYTPSYTAVVADAERQYIVYSMADVENLPSHDLLSAPDCETQRANARLIAAAPCLFSALELAQRILERDGIKPLRGEAFNDTEIRYIDAALAKAKGTAT